MAKTQTASAVTQPTTSAPPEPANQLAPIDLIRTGLEKMTPNLVQALPRHIPVERFKRTVLTALNLSPDLLGADRRSLFNAATKAAQDGLLPDGREGALVIFKDFKSGKQLVQWLPMTFGLIKKIRQSGEIASIAARVVYKNEIDQGRFKFLISEGEERLIHEPILWGDRGEPMLVYATAKFKDGTVQHEPMTKADVYKARGVSKSAGKEHSPWNKWEDEMWRKTAIKRLVKYLPLSAEDQRLRSAMARDNEVPSADFEVVTAGTPSPSQPQSLDAARMLGGPAEPDHDADTGEVIEQPQTETEPTLLDGEYTPGAEG
jgi:recombination protein RecT